MLLFWEEAFSAPVPHLGGIEAGEEPAQKEIIPRGWFAFIRKEHTLKMFQVQTCRSASWCAMCVKLYRSLLPPLLPTLQGPHLAASSWWQEWRQAGVGKQLRPIQLQWWPGSGWAPHLACVYLTYFCSSWKKNRNTNQNMPTPELKAKSWTLLWAELPLKLLSVLLG